MLDGDHEATNYIIVCRSSSFILCFLSFCGTKRRREEGMRGRRNKLVGHLPPFRSVTVIVEA